MVPLRIGLVADLFGTYPRRPHDAPDYEAELEPEETLEVLERAIGILGHEPVRLGAPLEVLARAGKGELPPIDTGLSIAEGIGSRNREAWGAVLLEMLGVPQLGSDALTRSLTLDKAWTRSVLAAADVRVPPQVSVERIEDGESTPLPAPFPLFVKPRWEGTAKGIRPSSRVEDRAGLLREVAHIVRTYRQPALVEPFLAGPEYTVAVVANRPPRALPALQRALDPATRVGAHALPGAADPQNPPILPGALDPGLERDLARESLRAYEVLRCQDFARMDFKLDEKGCAYLLEVNPLPTFAPDGTFAVLAELEGRSLEDLLAEILAAGLHRLGLAP